MKEVMVMMSSKVPNKVAQAVNRLWRHAMPYTAEMFCWEALQPLPDHEYCPPRHSNSQLTPAGEF